MVSLNALIARRCWHVRAAAEVGEGAVAVERDGLDALVATRSSISSTL